MVLITYKFQPYSNEYGRYCYSIEDTVEAFIDRVNDLTDGSYIVINVIAISPETARDWEGKLAGM